MKRLSTPLAGALLAGALALSACNPSSTVTVANNALATLAKDDIPAACGIITVAEGYFAEEKANISSVNVALEAAAVSAVAVICANPPANLTEAFADLLQEWVVIENATVKIAPTPSPT